jgi:hypothetical protein
MVVSDNWAVLPLFTSVCGDYSRTNDSDGDLRIGNTIRCSVNVRAQLSIVHLGSMGVINRVKYE